VLSLAFVATIWVQGLIQGMNDHAVRTSIDFEYGGGQFRHRSYDPYDPFTLDDSHAPLSPRLEELVSKGAATPILVISGAIYPGGRVHSAILKGIDPSQDILAVPSGHLEETASGSIPGLIGSQTADQTKLEIGDLVTARWRDVNGTFDADDVEIVQIMRNAPAAVDQGQLWVPLERLRSMLQAPGEATLVVLRPGLEDIPPGDTVWVHRDLDYLLATVREFVRAKSGGTRVMYGLLLFMGLLAVFDTQVLSIWRRRKEIGTLMALGMERAAVIGLFTVEGALHGILALIVGALYGIPLMKLTIEKGIPLPEAVKDVGVALPLQLYPSYGIRLLAGTTILVLVTVTVVSFLPASRIAKMKPTEALRGKRS
ncbi:MAG TPA: FtsX-like permease family protein, partial [Candidatus Eisenbacteria bacterium]|nr:FtsX-like permease family protein [Candidatus Eisenbacteria bacterium]